MLGSAGTAHAPCHFHEIQDGITLSPLSEFLGTDRPADPEPIDFVPFDDEKASGPEVFDYINQTLAWHQPAFSEVADMARFGRIEVVPGERFTTDGFSPEIIAALEEGVADAKGHCCVDRSLSETPHAFAIGPAGSAMKRPIGVPLSDASWKRDRGVDVTAHRRLRRT